MSWDSLLYRATNQKQEAKGAADLRRRWGEVAGGALLLDVLHHHQSDTGCVPGISHVGFQATWEAGIVNIPFSGDI